MKKEDKVVETLVQVDLSELKIPMAVIYNNPSDYPGKYVARIYEGATGQPTDTLIIRLSHEDTRKDIKAAGFQVFFTRSQDDEESIVETWMK